MRLCVDVFENCLPIDDFVTPESSTFFTHEHGRSPTDKEETAQWVAAPGTLRCILEALLSKVSSLKQQTCIIYNYTPYEGNLEKATATPRLMFKFGQVALELMNELNELLPWRPSKLNGIVTTLQSMSCSTNLSSIRRISPRRPPKSPSAAKSGATAKTVP